MTKLSLYRPLLLLLLPVGLLLISGGILVAVTLPLSLTLSLLLGALTLSAALAVVHAWSSVRFEIFGSCTFNGRVLSPVLVQHTGLFNQTEQYVALANLVEVTVRRPWLWLWCDGARITLHFTNREPVTLGLIGNPSAAVALLNASLPLATPLPAASAAWVNRDQFPRVLLSAERADQQLWNGGYR